MKDLIIGGFYGYDWYKIRYWINSINKSGFSGHKVIVATDITQELTDRISRENFIVVRTNSINGIPPHVQRFFHMWNFLKDVSEDIRYVISTDVRDVVFQRNPSEWLEQNLEDKKLLAASESMLYKDEPWGNQNLLECFGPWFHNIYKNNEIYNVGTLAGNFDVIRDLFLILFQMSINRPIPIVDQAVYNFLLWNEPYRSITKFVRSEDSWAAQLGTTKDPNKIDQFRPFLLENSPMMNEEKVLTSLGKEFTIVHQYDRVSDWRHILERKYG